MNDCATSQIKLVAFAALHDVLDRSPVGQNALFYVKWYGSSICDILRSAAVHHVDSQVLTNTTVSQAASAEFLRKLILLRDGRLTLSDNVEFLDDELAAACSYRLYMHK